MDRSDLGQRFRAQENFSADYSPLYTQLFGTLADWLADQTQEDIVDWLLSAAGDRPAFDVPLLLAAGLHREVLSQQPTAKELARYYPTVGGQVPATREALATALAPAIWARRSTLADFIQTATVQTNETSRGLAWLLPVYLSGWSAVHLVDLGASAGLNLIAERRSYQLITDQGKMLHTLGQGAPGQFVTRIHEQGGQPTPDLEGHCLPQIISRLGCDVAPFFLRHAEDEITLGSFIWGDQPQRLARLWEAIAASHQIQTEGIPVQLKRVSLPAELPHFLQEQVSPLPPAPIVLYNTYITIYLEDKGRALQEHIDVWAQEQNRSVWWIQWEPGWGGAGAPEYDWLAWTLDCWHGRDHQHYQLGWVQPHGTDLRWTPGVRQFVSTLPV